MTRKITLRESWRLYSCFLSYPLYIPPLATSVEELLIEGKLEEFYQELRRLASLGSVSASSLIGYLCLTGAFAGGPRPDLAEAYSAEGARTGDPYSQYVLGWACYFSNRKADAANWLLSSATKGLFLPATVDVAAWMAAGSGFKAPDEHAAVKTLWLATKRGHRFAVGYIVQLLLRGRFGLVGRLASVPAVPLILIWGAWASLRWPFDEKSFATQANPSQPRFKKFINASP